MISPELLKHYEGTGTPAETYEFAVKFTLKGFKGSVSEIDLTDPTQAGLRSAFVIEDHFPERALLILDAGKPKIVVINGVYEHWNREQIIRDGVPDGEKAQHTHDTSYLHLLRVDPSDHMFVRESRLLNFDDNDGTGLDLESLLPGPNKLAGTVEISKDALTRTIITLQNEVAAAPQT